jgi:hypothetical protein
VRTCAAEVQPVERHPVLRRAANRANEHELVQRQFAVVPVAAGDMELALDIRRRQQLARGDARLEVRRIPADRLDAGFRKCLFGGVRPPTLQRVRAGLNARST